MSILGSLSHVPMGKWVFRTISKSPVNTGLMGLSDTKLSWRRGWDFRARFLPECKKLTCPGLASESPPEIRPTLVRSFRLPTQLASRFQPVRILRLNTNKIPVLCTGILFVRRGWDSNPRSACTDDSFQDCSIRPLWHLSN